MRPSPRLLEKVHFKGRREVLEAPRSDSAPPGGRHCRPKERLAFLPRSPSVPYCLAHYPDESDAQGYTLE